jgi:hypothetical protein
MQEDERMQAANASPKIGEYLERLGKTDVATFTYDEWLEFICTVHDEYRHAAPF